MQRRLGRLRRRLFSSETVLHFVGNGHASPVRTDCRQMTSISSMGRPGRHSQRSRFGRCRRGRSPSATACPRRIDLQYATSRCDDDQRVLPITAGRTAAGGRDGRRSRGSRANAFRPTFRVPGRPDVARAPGPRRRRRRCRRGEDRRNRVRSGLLRRDPAPGAADPEHDANHAQRGDGPRCGRGHGCAAEAHRSHCSTTPTRALRTLGHTHLTKRILRASQKYERPHRPSYGPAS